MHLEKIIKTFKEEGRWIKENHPTGLVALTDYQTEVTILFNPSSKYYLVNLYVEEGYIAIGEEEPYFLGRVIELYHRLESDEQRKRRKADAEKKVRVCSTIDELYGD